MHEAGIAREIIETAIAAAKGRGAGKVTGIELLVGDFNNVVEEALRFNIEALASGTIAQGAAVEVKREPLEVECAQCGARGAPRDRLVFRCAECDGIAIEVISGKALRVVAIEVE